jgi:hypothetical protein
MKPVTVKDIEKDLQVMSFSLHSPELLERLTSNMLWRMIQAMAKGKLIHPRACAKKALEVLDRDGDADSERSPRGMPIFNEEHRGVNHVSE